MSVEKPLTLYAYTFPSRAERAIWMMNELGLDYQVIRLDPLKGEARTPEFKQINPMCKVPVLVHGETRVIESLAIMEYLHALRPEKALVPEGDTRFRQLIYCMQAEIESYLWIANQSSLLKGFYPWPDGTYEEALRQADRGLQYLYSEIGEREFLVGKAFTMADIYAHGLLGWARSHKKSHKLELPDNVLAYFRRIRSRPTLPKRPNSDQS